MTALKDPLSHAQETFEAYICASPAVRVALKNATKNVDGFTATRGTKQVDTRSEADMPLVKLIPTGGPCNVNFASNATNWDFNLQIGLASGDMRYTERLAPLAWAIYAALSLAIHEGAIVGLTLAKCLPPTAPSTLKNYEYVKNMTLSNIATGVADLSDPKNRGIAGFSALMDLTLHLLFPRGFVKAWASQDFTDL